jgi:hypothetical protein
MSPELQALMDQLEAQRQVIIAEFRSVPMSRFNHSPRPGKWSAAQIFSHLLSAERLTVAYMRKKVLGIATTPRSGLWEELKMAILIMSQRVPGLKYTAPGYVVQNTSAYEDLPSIESAWSQIRADLRSLLETIPLTLVDRKIYKHPVAGYLNARHALIFFREHIIHHTPQLQRLKS